MSIPLYLAVNPAVPARTLPEFIAYARANAGKVNMGSAGVGSVGHLAGELLNMMTGTGLVHVPYRGNGPALAALLGGEVQVVFPTPPSSIEFIRTGKIRGLATTGATRAEALPDMPTVGEVVPGYEVSAWYGVGAPRGTPAEVVDKIGREINAGLADPKMKARFADLGGVPMPMPPADLVKLIAEEIEKWAKGHPQGEHQADVNPHFLSSCRTTGSGAPQQKNGRLLSRSFPGAAAGSCGHRRRHRSPAAATS